MMFQKLINTRIKIAVFLCSLLFSTTNFASDEVINIDVVAPEIKPLIYVDEKGDNAGLIIDSIEQINTQSKLKIHLRILPWARAMKQVLNKQADAILPALYTEERAKQLSFPSSPFINFSPPVLLKRSSDDFIFEGFDALSSKKSIAKVRAVLLGKSFNEALNKHLIDIVEVSRLEDAIQMLKLKRVDFVIADSFVHYTLESMGSSDDISILKISNDIEPSFISFSKAFSNSNDINEIMAIINRYNNPDTYYEGLN